MRYDFDKNIAKQLGVEEAIMYENIAWWCHKNATERSETHFHEGHYWTWNTEEAWAELFGFWTGKQCSRILGNLEKAGLLATGMFNKKGYDRTKWFRPKTPVYTELEAKSPFGLLDKTKRAAPSTQTGAPIPDSINTDNTETQGASRRSRSLKKVEAYEKQEEIPGIQEVSDNQRSLIKTLYELGWRWPKSKTAEEFGKSVKSALLVSGIAYHTTQGTFGINQNLFDSELGSFQAYYEAKPTANPLSAFLGWMNRRAKK